MSSKLSKILSGVSGEYFVAAELSRRGYVASLTLKNTQGIDLLAAKVDASRSVAIQVKTNQGSAHEWLLDKKVELPQAPHLFFVFVALRGQDTPRYHVVPGQVVSEYCTRTHREYLAAKGRGGRTRKDTDMRSFKNPGGAYVDKWELLGLD